MELAVRKIRDEATLPSRAHDGDAGLDLYACEMAHIGPGERWSVGTGVAVEVPAGTLVWSCRVRGWRANMGSRWSIAPA